MIRVALAATLLTACAPQNADISVGDYTVYLSDNGSVTLRKGRIDPNGYENHTAVDCRLFESARNNAQNEQLRLGGPEDGFDRLKICPGDRDVSSSDWPPVQEEWLDFDGFHVLTEDLSVWRGEGIITGEGDLQIGFHHRAPGGADLRFAIVIDPNFQPRQCRQTADGEGVELVDLDGNWLEEWSKDAPEGGTTFYLNAGGYQFNPRSVESYNPSSASSNLDLWILPREWLAGYAEGHLGDDRFIMRGPRYADPGSYLSYEYAEAGAGAAARIGVNNLYMVDYCGDDCADDAKEDANVAYSELVRAGLPERDDLPSYKPRVHDNAWREYDGNQPGIDGWVEMHYNWIRFDEGSSFEKGGEASGEFALVMDALESASRIFIRGRFEVKRWKNDVWTTAFLPPIKYEQNETSLCGVPPDQVGELF